MAKPKLYQSTGDRIPHYLYLLAKLTTKDICSFVPLLSPNRVVRSKHRLASRRMSIMLDRSSSATPPTGLDRRRTWSHDSLYSSSVEAENTELLSSSSGRAWTEEEVSGVFEVVPRLPLLTSSGIVSASTAKRQSALQAHRSADQQDRARLSSSLSSNGVRKQEEESESVAQR